MYVLQIIKSTMLKPALAPVVDSYDYSMTFDVYPAAVSDDPNLLEQKGRELARRYPSAQITWQGFEAPEVTV